MAETVKKAKAPAKPRKTAAKSAAKSAETIEQAKPVLVTHDQIAQLAHRFWSERGNHHGNPQDDWFRAEEELRGKAS